MSVIGPRIAVTDIETSPISALIWRLGDQTVTLDQIEEDWSILSFCWKWLGEKGHIYKDTGGRGPSKTRDDRCLMKPLWELLDEADIVIAQNGRQFDIKKINARMIIHGYKPYSPIKIVDTLEAAKKHFGFTSNKLQYLAEKLAKTKKDRHNDFPGLELWRECLKDNPKAWKSMRTYNPVDVISTSQVYETMLPWISNHPNVAAWIQDEKPRCTHCGSTKLQRKGHSYTQAGVYPRWRCNDCSAPLRGRMVEMERKVRKNLLANIV